MPPGHGNKALRRPLVRYSAHVNLKEWAAREGIAYVTARRWFAAGKLPVPARKVGGLILVEPGRGDVLSGIDTLAVALVAACSRAYGSAQAETRAHAAVSEAAADA